MCIKCNNPKIMARGLCQRCYDIARQVRCPNECDNYMARGARQCQPCHFAEKAARAEAEQEQTLANKKASRLKWYYNNQEHAQTKHREWKDNNQDKIKQYEAEHIDERRHYVESRRARLLDVDDGLTASEWKRLLQMYNHTCVYCMEKFESLEQDHVIPLSSGGKHSVLNVVPACLKCNRRKSTSIQPPKHPVYWGLLAMEAASKVDSTTPARP